MSVGRTIGSTLDEQWKGQRHSRDLRDFARRLENEERRNEGYGSNGSENLPQGGGIPRTSERAKKSLVRDSRREEVQRKEQR